MKFTNLILLFIAMRTSRIFADFNVKSISQSSPIVSAANTISVSLASDTTLPAATQITITGFFSASADPTLTLLAVSGGNNGHTLFSIASFQSGTILLTVSPSQSIIQSVTYSFSFLISNPSSVPTPPSISIGSSTYVAAMDVPNLSLLGVNNGQNPLVSFSS
jgi:hypothetical protein